MTSVTYADLKGKVVLITGSSKALGAETARQFAACGARLVVNGRDEQAIERVTGSIRSEWWRVHWYRYGSEFRKERQITAPIRISARGLSAKADRGTPSSCC